MQIVTTDRAGPAAGRALRGRLATTVRIEDRIRGALWGLLVGDALGVPYEFHGPETVPPVEQVEMEPPPGFERAHAGVPPGTWSDDGAQALCLLASLLHCDRLDPDDFMRRLVNWREHGYLASGGRVFDIGIQTAAAIGKFQDGARRALDCGGAGERSNGNGSLMRVLPLALWHRGDDRALVRDARLQSQITHAHVRAQICCALYCLWARRILQEHDDPWGSALAALRELLADEPAAIYEFEFYVRPAMDGRAGGSGYVVDCLRSAHRVLSDHDGYETVVRAAIRLGHDTDTTACVAGGIAGLREGVNAIPPRWRAALRDKGLFAPLLEDLLRRV